MLAAEVGLEAPGPSHSDVMAQQQLFAKQQQRELEEYEREMERRQVQEQKRVEREVQQMSLRQGVEPLARVSAGSGASAGAGRLLGGPALEVTVMRVVGCEMLTNGLTGRDFTIVTYAGTRPGGGGSTCASQARRSGRACWLSAAAAAERAECCMHSSMLH